MRRTIGLALLAFSLGVFAMVGGVFPLRFLWVAYQHGGLF